MKPEKRQLRMPQGVVATVGTLDAEMHLVEFGELRSVRWTCLVVEDLPYGAILGRDLMQHFGVVIDFGAATIPWDGVSISMRSSRTRMDATQLRDEVQRLMTVADSPVHQAEER